MCCCREGCEFLWFGSDLVFGGFPEDILDFELENLIVLLDG